ncbi:MAG: apolipoprotein N-acyltransferase [Nitrospirae bacterium GWD2_57_9]|nr:MAG: apolipoprotein N-acyltransferase [Nitrospirae bacterium GWD2_57_9]
MNWRSSALAAVSGLLLAAGFPNIDLHLLAWIGLVPLLYALKDQKNVMNGFWLGGISGLAFFSATVHWVTNSVHFYGNVPLIPASLITLLLCAYLALYPALFGLIVVDIMSRRPSLLFIAAPAAWTALELARTYVFSGFPWALLGYSQYTALPVIQIADTTGVYGISFLIVMVNASVAAFAFDRKKIAGLIAGCVVISLVLAYGYLRLGMPENAGGIRVSVIQGNIEQDKKWDPAYQRETINIYKSLTVEALKQQPDLVIWPETSTPFYFNGNSPEERRLTVELREFVKKNKVPLLFGSPTYEIKQYRNVILRNSAFLISTDGEVAAKYDKFHLVPFGEYVPLKNVLFFVEKMVQAIGDFWSGYDYTVMSIPNKGAGMKETRISTVICYEIIFPDLVRKFVDRGAGIVTTITNDAWFGRTSAPYQHFSMAVFRAVENRVPVARAANTGVSGFIDAKGRILAASYIFTPAHLTGTLTPGIKRTFYSRHGDVFSYACTLLSVLTLIFARKYPSKRLSS